MSFVKNKTIYLSTMSNNLIHTLDLEITTGGIFPNSVSVLPAGPKTRPLAFLAGN